MTLGAPSLALPALAFDDFALGWFAPPPVPTVATAPGKTYLIRAERRTIAIKPERRHRFTR